MRSRLQPASTAAVRLARRGALFCLLALLIAAFPAWAEQTVRVGLYQNSPKVAVSETGKPEGIFVDLIEAIAEKEGWSLEYVAGTWHEGLGRLEAGQIDLMPDVAHTTERERVYAFHREPVLSSWNQVYARRGSSIRSLPDLEGRRVAVLEGSTQEDLFRAMVSGFALTVELLPQPDFAAAFRAVAEGKADAVVTNRFYGMRNAGKFGLEDSAIIFAPSRLHFAAPKNGNPLLLAAIDRHIKAFKKDSTSVYYRSLRRWTTDETPPAVPQWLIFALLAGLALLGAAAAWLILLRQQVAARTAAIRRSNEEIASVNQSLRESERKYRELVENANSIILRWTHDGRIIFLNEFGQRFFGYTEDEIHGRHVVGTIVPEAESNGRNLKPLMEKICKNPAAFEQNVNENMRRNGERVWIAWTNKVALDPQGQIAEILSIGTDITALKQAEEALRATQAGLEQRVIERTAELAEAKYAAEAADRLKSAFLATMSHELRTPLNSIIGFTGIILQELAGPLNAEQKKQLGMVQGSARHLLALINDVLDISKIEAGELTVAAEPFDLAASIRKVAGIITPLAEKKGLALAVNVAGSLGTMFGDARRVEQILLNLLGNAIKFTEAGSVILTVEPVVDHARAAGAASVPAVRLRVADTGIGIKPEDMAMLFTPFRQVDSAMTRQHDGTGLGLAICRRLAELMGGHIEAQSRWGEGSEFILTLPLCLEKLESPHE